MLHKRSDGPGVAAQRHLSISFGVSMTYRLNKSETISTSVSAAAIFCSEESWGRPPKRKDMVTSVLSGVLFYVPVSN